MPMELSHRLKKSSIPKVERISKIWPRSNVKCSGEVTDALKAYRDRAAGAWNVPHGYNCTRFAQYQIDDKPYCALHGGKLLLNALCRG